MISFYEQYKIYAIYATVGLVGLWLIVILAAAGLSLIVPMGTGRCLSYFRTLLHVRGLQNGLLVEKNTVASRLEAIFTEIVPGVVVFSMIPTVIWALVEVGISWSGIAGIAIWGLTNSYGNMFIPLFYYGALFLIIFGVPVGTFYAVSWPMKQVLKIPVVVPSVTLFSNAMKSVFLYAVFPWNYQKLSINYLAGDWESAEEFFNDRKFEQTIYWLTRGEEDNQAAAIRKLSRVNAGVARVHRDILRYIGQSNPSILAERHSDQSQLELELLKTVLSDRRNSDRQKLAARLLGESKSVEAVSLGKNTDDLRPTVRSSELLRRRDCFTFNPETFTDR